MFTKKRQRQLIENASKMMTNAQSEWAKKFWFGVWKKLCQKFGREN